MKMEGRSDAFVRQGTKTLWSKHQKLKIGKEGFSLQISTDHGPEFRLLDSTTVRQELFHLGTSLVL